MRAEKGFSNLVLVFVAVLLLGSVAFIGISPINLNAAAPPASDGRAQNTSPSISFGGGGDAEYLIITRQMFESALQPLVDLKKQRMSVKVITLEEIIGKEWFYSTSIDGYIMASGEGAHDAETGVVYDDGDYFTIGQTAQSPSSIQRGFVFFDTSSIPDDATIASATLSLYGLSDYSIADFYITVQNGQPNYPHESLESGDYCYDHYSGNGGSLHTSGFTTTGYNHIELNWIGMSWINPTGTTKLCLRDSYDIYNQHAEDSEYITVYASEKGTGYQPYLEITYSLEGIYPGRDIPEQIRNCIKDHYGNHGTQWVLLAGDVDPDEWKNGYINYNLDKEWEVPIRYVSEPPMPTDFYYADLDDDEVAEVYVGRIPARDASTMQVVIDKTVAYELNPPRKIKDVCFFAASGCALIKREVKRDIIPSEISVHEFYESDDDLDQASFLNAINDYNPVLVNAAGHGNPYGITLDEGGPFADINTPDALVNKGFLMFSFSCYTNVFVISDNCLGEAMLQDPDGGAVGYVGYVSEAYGSAIDIAFFKEIFWDQEYHQGAIFYKAIERAGGLGGLMLALLGDPELKIVAPVLVSISPGHGSGLPGVALTYSVTVRNISNRSETYTLTAADDAGWNPGISPNTLTIPADENRTATLSVIVPSSAPIGTEDKITVTATSTENAEASDNASCIAHAGLRMVIYPSADVCTYTHDQATYHRTQLKFNINNTPGAGVVSARLWLYRYRNSGGDWDGGVTVNRVDDPTWDESITADQFNAQSLTDQQNHGGKWMSDGWDFLAVLDQLKVDRNAGDAYTSLRLRWADDDGTQPIPGCGGDTRLDIGSSYSNEPIISFYSSEYSDPAYHPYLEIIYVPLVEISPSYQSGLPGGTLTYTVMVTNAGDFANNYNLYLENRWEATLSPSRLEDVQPMETKATTLTVKIHELETIGEYDDIIVTAVSERYPAESDISICIAQASSHVSPWEDSSSKGRDEPPHHLENSLWGRAGTIDVGRYDDGPERGWLKFDLRAFTPGTTIIRANLSLNCCSTEGANVRVHGVGDDSWSEYTINWLNKPSIGGVLDTRAVFEGDKWYSWDVTSFVQSEYAGDKVASFCLVDIGEHIAPDHAALFSSKEYEENMPYLEILAVLPDRDVRAYVEPTFQGGLIGDTLTYTITVMNKGAGGDNYDLTVENTEPWSWTLDDTLLEVPAGENRTTTLSVTIPSGTIGTIDYITITATSRGNSEVYDKARCQAHRSKATMSLKRLYDVKLDLNALLRDDANYLVLEFYDYGDGYENENVLWSTMPAHLEDIKDIRHPQGKVTVRKTKLALTDADGNTIQTLSTLIVYKVDLEIRFAEIPLEWLLAQTQQEKTDINIEAASIPLAWLLAP